MLWWMKRSQIDFQSLWNHRLIRFKPDFTVSSVLIATLEHQCKQSCPMCSCSVRPKYLTLVQNNLIHLPCITIHVYECVSSSATTYMYTSVSFFHHYIYAYECGSSSTNTMVYTCIRVCFHIPSLYTCIQVRIWASQVRKSGRFGLK